METQTSANAKILVVDDNPKNIQVIANILTNAQYSVGYATDGQMALNTLHNANDYDLALLDIDMPILNGLEACRNIRKNDKLRNIPVIFLTAFTDTEKIVAGFEAGAQDYVTKPFNSQELLARVKTHVELKKSREILLNVNKYLEDQVIQRTEELSIANEKLDKANAQLEQLDQAKTEFLHILSHEIRTPLNGVIGSLDLLKMNKLPDKTDKLLNILDKSVKRLEQFSYQTLDITCLRTKGSKALTISELNINTLIDRCINEFKKHANCKNLTVNRTQETSIDQINGDENYIYNSLKIVFGNAINHSPENETIIIETNALNEMFVLQVTDRGKGFPDKMLDQSFLPFNTGNAHVNANMGLDLHFVKLVMDAHSGIIEIGNNSNGGGFVKLMFKTNDLT